MVDQEKMGTNWGHMTASIERELEDELFGYLMSFLFIILTHLTSFNFISYTTEVKAHNK